jgi:hypothetical protein
LRGRIFMIVSTIFVIGLISSVAGPTDLLNSVVQRQQAAHKIVNPVVCAGNFSGDWRGTCGYLPMTGPTEDASPSQFVEDYRINISQMSCDIFYINNMLISVGGYHQESGFIPQWGNAWVMDGATYSYWSSSELSWLDDSALGLEMRTTYADSASGQNWVTETQYRLEGEYLSVSITSGGLGPMQCLLARFESIQPYAASSANK